jgi:hypothetical protein
MPLSDSERDLYLAWYRTTHLALPTYSGPLDAALARFRAVFRDETSPSSATATNPPLHLSRIMGPTITHFHFANAMLNRWPILLRRTLNRSDPFDSPLDHPLPLPFHTWAQPKYIERRKQAVAVWYTLLHFLALNWAGYGGAHGPLHHLGLDPSRHICDLIDDFRLYATIQKPFRPRSKVVEELVDAFFLLVVREFDPTPRTNPILWWLAVLIHSDLHRCHPRLPVPGLEDSLDFTAKLDALDHYSRVLVFHNTFIDWTTLRNPSQPLPSNQLEVARWVDAANIAWVDRDREAPQSDSVEDVDLESPAWSEYHHHLRTAVNAWLVADTEGPMREIIALRRGVLLPARPSSSATPSRAIGPFRIGYNAVQEWSRDPRVLSGLYPATSEKRYQSLLDANLAAVEFAHRTLLREVEEDHEEMLLDELDEIFPVGGDVPQAFQWDIAELPDGTVRVRALYVNRNENVKVTAWVERE